MKRQDQRTNRQWVKVQLKNDADARHAAEIVEYWRHLKQAAHHLTRAIRMYYALTLGDTTLLRQYFPLEVDSMRAGAPIRPTPTSSAPTAPPKIEIRARTEDEDKSDLLDMF